MVCKSPIERSENTSFRKKKANHILKIDITSSENASKIHNARFKAKQISQQRITLTLQSLSIVTQQLLAFDQPSADIECEDCENTSTFLHLQ